MRRLFYIILTAALLLGLFIWGGLALSNAQTVSQISPFRFVATSTTISPIFPSSSFQVPLLGSAGSPCVVISNTSGTFATSTCGGTASINLNANGVTFVTGTSTVNIEDGTNTTVVTSTRGFRINASVTGGSGTVTTGTAVTANQFPYWVSDGVLSGTSSLSRSGNNINASGTISTNGVQVSTTTGANPSASVGLSAVNGSANTFVRSDAAPALSQSITPTWSGLHTYTGGATFNSTSTNNSSTLLIGQTSVGTSTLNGALNISGAVNQAGGVVFQASTTVNGNTTSTSLTVTGVTSALGSFSSAGVLSAYGGASACSSGNFVTTISATGGTTCAALASANFANPTATIGLSATNGSATTAMRSDAAPALSQSIVPTWTGLHTFTSGLTVNSTSTHASSTLITGTLQIPTSTPASTAQIAATSTGFLYHDGTAARKLNDIICTDFFTIQNVTSSVSDVPLHYFENTSTLYSVVAYNDNVGGNLIDFNIVWNANAVISSSSANHAFTANATSTATSTPYRSTSFASSSIPGGSVMRWVTGSTASTTQASVQACWRTTP